MQKNKGWSGKLKAMPVVASYLDIYFEHHKSKLTSWLNRSPEFSDDTSLKMCVDLVGLMQDNVVFVGYLS